MIDFRWVRPKEAAVLASYPNLRGPGTRWPQSAERRSPGPAHPGRRRG